MRVRTTQKNKRRTYWRLHLCSACSLEWWRKTTKDTRIRQCPSCGESEVPKILGCQSKSPFHTDVSTGDKPITYRGYIKGYEWRKKRKLVVLRDGGLCRACGKLGSHVHHTHYRSFGKEATEDLVLLCNSCHAKEHKDYWLPNREDFWSKQIQGVHGCHGTG